MARSASVRKGTAMQIKKLAVTAGAVGALALSLVTAAPASADYSPSAGDAVGVGSDTLQFASDFVADGDALGDLGYNSAGNLNKLVNIDATADAGARLAYGPDGKTSTPGSAICAPGTGNKTGSGNLATSATNIGNNVCQQNSMVVLRAGLRPVRRPNGSGDGAKALSGEILAGIHNIDYARASGSQLSGVFTPAGTASSISTVTMGHENVAMLGAGGTALTNIPAGGLSKGELTALYTSTTTTNVLNPAHNGLCPTWADLSVYRVAQGGTAITSPSATTIKPLIPQAGSGTRSYFIGQIGVTEGTLGNCTIAAEENDPTAIAANGGADAIEPMSSARLKLFQGFDSTGASTSLKYFTDPSCVYGSTSNNYGPAYACGTTAAITTVQALTPQVQLFDAGSTSDTQFTRQRDLYIYIRTADLDSQTPFQPGFAANLMRTLLANPCSGTGPNNQNLNTNKTGCSTINGITYGPGGQPYYAQSSATSLISAAGIVPAYNYTPSAL